MKGFVALFTAPLLIVGMVVGVVMVTDDSCNEGGIVIDPTKLPAEAAGYSGDELANAVAILNAGGPSGAKADAQKIALMTAIAESDLENLDTDRSKSGQGRLGLFQQPDDGKWGTAEDRQTPRIAAANFYTALLAVPEWEKLSPSLAAQAVQKNSNPEFFTPSAAKATTIIEALDGAQPNCEAGAFGEVNAKGWTAPAAGPIGSGFGPRTPICFPGGCTKPFHSGIDIINDLKTPIYAVNAGTVVAAGPNSGFGNWIVIDHGEGITTVYGHMYGNGVFVKPGQKVKAGQNIGQIGCAGTCTGAHVHFEVHRVGTGVDPVAFLKSVDVEVG